jgi:hypothetical protein
MNDSIQRQLQHVVDAAIAPVRASAARKAAMREELLAHVSEVFADELSQSHDEKLALVTTTRRFGAAVDLGPQINDSLPFFESWFHISEKELLMSRWFWLTAVAAIAIGPAIILPAMAKLRDEGILMTFPFVLGTVVLLAGVAAAGYGAARQLTGHA